QRLLAEPLGCALSEDVVAPIDVPPFDRSNVDGFAVRSADLASAGETTAIRMMLNDEVIACGTAPTRPVLSGTATLIATGGPVPRGADAIVMVEHTQPSGPRAIEIRRAASPGQFVSYAGSDIARGEALLRAGTVIGSGGTAKGAGDVSHRIISRRGKPGIIAHGVALKPGKPLCLAVCDAKPVIILPGFPTSAMFTFHDMIVPVLRRMAGLPPRSDAKV